MFQSEALPPVIRGLLEPGAYPHEARRVTLVQTHISYVLLAGQYAYKLKKALDLGFLDYSTLERRRQMCDEEVRLNRRLCTGVYLGVVPVVRRGVGYAVEAGGEPVEYAVKMRRVPSERMLPALLERGEVTPAHMRSLARTIAAFHQHAETNADIAAYGRVQAVRRNWEQNFAQISPFVGRYLSAAEFEALRAYAADFLDANGPLIEERAARGRTRDVHGDLRADSVVFDGERATCIMDCIEFDPGLRYGDVASDIAFLAMDLDARGVRNRADEVISFYLECAADETMPAMMPFYLCYRAVVRGKVHSLEADERDVPEAQRARAADEARRRFELALGYAASARPGVLMIMCGLTGTGKSFVANALAARIGAAVVSSDAVRIEMFAGADAGPPRAPDSAGPYTEERRRAVYARMRERAEAYLRAGRSVVLDATHERRSDRDAARELARACGAHTALIAIEEPVEVTHARLDAREAAGGGISGGTWEVYQAQRQRFEAVSADEHAVTVRRSDDLARDVEITIAAMDATAAGARQTP